MTRGWRGSASGESVSPPHGPRPAARSAPLRRFPPARAWACAVLWILAACPAVRGAEFDLFGPSLELRQTQACVSCEATLVVTAVPQGAHLRCPVCDTTQRRRGPEGVTTRVYQVCPDCGARLDVSRHAPGETVRCGECSRAQTVLRAASRLAQPPIPPEAAPPSPPPARAEAVRAMAPPAPEGLDAAEPALPPPDLRFESRPPPPLTTRPLDIPGLPPIAAPGSGETPVPSATVETAPAAPLGEGEAPAAFRTRTIALVNGSPIPAEAYEAAVEARLEAARLRIGSAGESARGRELLERREEEIREGLLRAMIDRELVLQEARAEGVEPELPEVYERAEMLRREGRLRLPPKLLMERARAEVILEAMLRRHVPPPRVAPGEVRQFYAAHREEFLQPPRAALRTLVIYHDRAGRRDDRAAETIAREVGRRLAAGEDFAALLAELSEDPFAGAGGLLRQNGSALVPTVGLARPVREALRRARSGSVLGPFRLAAAIAFVRVEDLRPSEPLPFSQVSGDIRARLMRERQEERLRTWVESLRREAEVRLLLPDGAEVDPGAS